MVQLIKNFYGKRHGDGCWAPPGGHLEYGESWQQCAQREALEETGLVLDEVRFCAVTNDIFAESNKHYVTIFMRAAYTGGVVQNREPEKCEQWQWLLYCLSAFAQGSGVTSRLSTLGAAADGLM